MAVHREGSSKKDLNLNSDSPPNQLNEQGYHVNT